MVHIVDKDNKETFKEKTEKKEVNDEKIAQFEQICSQSTQGLSPIQLQQIQPVKQILTQLLQRMVAIKLQQNLNHFIPQITSIYSIRLPYHRMNKTATLNQPSKRTVDFRQKYKTEKCRYWYQAGFCPFFQSCAFAHADFELRDRHAINQNYKTKICSNFKNYGYCKYGERCQFLHVQQALMPEHCSRVQVEHFPSISWQKKSVSTNEEMDSKHRNDLKLLSEFGLDILSVKKGNRSVKWRSLLEQSETLGRQSQREQWSEAVPENRDFEQMFPEYNFFKKPRLASI